MLLIDGYNLAHVTRFKPIGQDEQTLRKSREGLLAFLVRHLPEEQFPDVIVVFDSSRSFARLPTTMQWGHIQVEFSRDYVSADELIELKIRSHPAPRTLLVVSSDHQLQLAAKRRRANFVDSDVWYDRLLGNEVGSSEPPEPAPQTTFKQQAAEALADEDWSEMLQVEDSHPDPIEGGTREREANHPFPPEYLDELRRSFPDET